MRLIFASIVACAQKVGVVSSVMSSMPDPYTEYLDDVHAWWGRDSRQSNFWTKDATWTGDNGGDSPTPAADPARKEFFVSLLFTVTKVGPVKIEVQSREFYHTRNWEKIAISRVIGQADPDWVAAAFNDFKTTPHLKVGDCRRADLPAGAAHGASVAPVNY